ncbi:Protein CHROMATIN REMODELING 24, partial [Cucurbita argyrosperma subsp. sororia]
MADSTTSRKKPLSLNDRHYRLLQDLSAPPKPSLATSRDQRAGDEDEKPSRIELENQCRLSEVSTNVDELHDNSVPQSSGVNVDEQPRKVKIGGRRRLCKLSSREDGYVDNPVGFDFSEPNFSGITDFDSPSPPPPPPLDHRDNKGSDIRDILNDLSTKLELLSVEKKREKPRKFDSLENLSASYCGKGIEEASEADEREVDSLKFSTNPSNSLLGENAKVENVVKTLNDGLSGEYGVEIPPNKVKVDVFYKGTHEVDTCSTGSEQLLNLEYGNNKHHEGRDKYTHQDVQRSYNSLGKTPALIDEGEVDLEDDCIVLNRETRNFNEVRRQHDKYEKKSDDSDGVDMFDKSAEDFILEGKTSTGHKSAFKLQGRIAKMLYPHQREGLRWLWSLHCRGNGGILGDDMGLGKTMQICGFLAGLFYSRLIKRVLVVAPKTLLPHWIKELAVVGLSEKTREYYGTSAKLRQYELNYILQDKGVLLTTYDIVRNNSQSLQGNSFFDDEETEDGTTWDYMILDEGHLIKNPSTQRAKSLLEIPSAHRIIISGTPLQNNLKELWALFNFCCPDLLGDKKWFKEYYECAILRGNDKKASERDKRVGSMAAKELRERIQPYFLRRMKSEVFNEDNDQAATKLSKKNDIIVWLKLTSCQRKLYEAFLKSELVLSAFDGSPLAALTILKKICDHPLLLTKRAAEDLLEGMETVLSPEDAGVAEKLAMHLANVADRDDYEVYNDNVSCKISFIMSLLDNLIPKGHNVLIFSQTRKMLNLIEESLLSNDYEFLRIDGTTKATDRVKIVNDFQEGRGPSIFLLTSQVGGLGLTLTRADRVIVVDPAWNPSTDNQSVDRAYRIGQKKDVIVYRLMTCGTVEEKIYRKQIYKGGLFKTATEHKEQIRYFSQQDLRELFSLPKEGFDISVTQQQLHEEHDRQITMDDSLKCHIKFLETQGIAGVSHHNLLFSKTAPEPVHVLEEEEASFRRNKAFAFGERATSSSSPDPDTDGARFAFNPKDVKLNRFATNASSSPSKPTEREIKERINRLSQTLENKVLISRLPDRGERIQKQIVELNLQLSELKRKEHESEVIDITDEFQKVLNV